MECRGHAGILDQRFFPTRAAGQYGSIARRDEDEWIDVKYHASNDRGHDKIYQYADFNPADGHGPFSPGWQQYLRSVRFWHMRRLQPYAASPQLTVGIYELGQNNRPGALAAPETHVVDVEDWPTSPGSAQLNIDWVRDVAPLTRLPAGGWYFGIHSTGSDVQGAGGRCCCGRSSESGAARQAGCGANAMRA